MSNIVITENDTSTLVLKEAIKPTFARVLKGTATGTTYKKGTLLALDTADDKHTVYDGTNDIVAVLEADVEGETGVDKSIFPYVGGVFDLDKLVIQSGASIGAAEEVLMQKAGLYFQRLTELAKLDNNNG